MRVHVSINAESKGGGSNTFAALFSRYIKESAHQEVSDMATADLAVVIAHRADEGLLVDAKARGCVILHRLDEYFEQDESAARREKHEKIRALNRLADVTIYQSEFVFENVHPFLNPSRYEIVRNGGDPKKFKPGRRPGSLIGHVSWGIDTKKRLDAVHEFIAANPELKFLLVGRHREHELDFGAFANVEVAGEVRHDRLPRYFRRMKMLYFPSELDPCPNTVVEAILSGVPVCYSRDGGGAPELVGDCGMPLDSADELLSDCEKYRERCLNRTDLQFQYVFERYMSIGEQVLAGVAA